MQVAILGEEQKAIGDQIIEEEVKGDPRLIFADVQRPHSTQFV